MLGLLVLGHRVQLVCQNGQCTCRKRHVTIAKRAASMTLNETSVGSSRSFIRLGTVSTCSTSIHTESMYVRVGRGARRFESKAPFYQCYGLTLKQC